MERLVKREVENEKGVIARLKLKKTVSTENQGQG